MELAAVLLGLAIIVVILGTPIVAVIALARTSKYVEELRELRAEVTALRSSVRRLPHEAPHGSSGVSEVAVESSESEIAAVPDFRRVSMRTRVSRPPYLRTTPSDPPPEAAEAAEDAAVEAETVPEPAVDAASTETESAPRRADTVVLPDAPASVAGPPPEDDARPETRPVQGGLAAARTAIDFETLIGSAWLLRIGLGVLAIAFALFARSIVPQLPPAAKVALAYAAAMALFATGKVFETKLEKFARPVMAAGLAFGFFVAYASYFVPAMGAVSLSVSVGWMVVSMVTVLLAAERWGSQGTAALAILLGHISAHRLSSRA